VPASGIPWARLGDLAGRRVGLATEGSFVVDDHLGSHYLGIGYEDLLCH
jgi:hypothetical protein